MTWLLARAPKRAFSRQIKHLNQSASEKFGLAGPSAADLADGDTAFDRDDDRLLAGNAWHQCEQQAIRRGRSVSSTLDLRDAAMASRVSPGHPASIGDGARGGQRGRRRDHGARWSGHVRQRNAQTGLDHRRQRQDASKRDAHRASACVGARVLSRKHAFRPHRLADDALCFADLDRLPWSRNR